MSRLANTEYVLEGQAKILKGNSHLLFLHILEERLNLLGDQVVVMENSFFISTLVGSLYSQIAYYTQYINQLLNNVKILKKHSLTPSLLSLAELSKLEVISTDVTGFNPAVVIEKYYTYSSSEVAPGTTYLHIPFVVQIISDINDFSPFQIF